jgi:hypothetical protein
MKKLQIPSTKLQRNFKLQSPNKVVGGAVDFVVLEVWSFPGAWLLVLGISSIAGA